MKTQASLKALLGAFALITGCSTIAIAQVTVDVSQITCKQFVLREVAKPRSLAIWLSGYYSGKRGLPTVDVQAFEKNIKEVERFCTKVDNLEIPLMQAVENVMDGAK